MRQALSHLLSRGRARVSLSTGSFAAASNLTGALEDTDVITEILHRGGALSFWDYATAAPYVEIDMNLGATMKSDRVSRGRLKHRHWRTLR